VGSIGVVAIIEDLSERANQMGVKVHVVRSGKYKGVGAPGVPVTEEDLSYFQERIKPFHNQFVSRVMSGRRMRKGDVEELADGRIHIAKKAMELGLIDKVARLDDAMASARKTIRSIQSHKRTKAKINELNNSLIKDKLDAL
jgi:protease-4